jgi:hypothetical protein
MNEIHSSTIPSTQSYFFSLKDNQDCSAASCSSTPSSSASFSDSECKSIDNVALCAVNLKSTSEKDIHIKNSSLSNLELASIQAKQLEKNLEDYHYDFFSIPSQLTNELLKSIDSVKTISINGLLKYPDWNKRLSVLQHIFKKAVFKASYCDFSSSSIKLKEEDDLEKKEDKTIFLQALDVALPKMPEKKTIYACLNSSSIDPLNFPKPQSPLTPLFPLITFKELPQSNLRKHGRTIISELSNTSITIGSVYHRDGIFNSNFSNQIKGPSPDSIDLRSRCEAHLSNRLQLLYVLALACFNSKQFEGLSLIRSKTIMQIGTGCHKLLEASHSAIITNVNIGISRKYLFDKAIRSRSEKLIPDEKLREISELYEFDLSKLSELSTKSLASTLKLNDPRLSDLSKPLVPYESDLGQNLSATIKLPSYCNQLDSECEADLRDPLMDYLNSCFEGKISPATVYNCFIKHFEEFLTRKRVALEKEQAYIFSHLLKLQSDLEKAILQLFDPLIDDDLKINQVVTAYSKFNADKLTHIDSTLSSLYDDLVQKCIDYAKSEMFDDSDDIEKFMKTAFSDIGCYSDVKVLPILQKIKIHLSKAMPDGLQELVSLSCPDELADLEHSNVIIKDSNSLGLAVLGFEWINKGVLAVIRSKKVLLLSKNMSKIQLIESIKEIFHENRQGFGLKVDHFINEQKIALIDLYLSLIKDAPSLLPILSTESSINDVTGLVEPIAITQANIESIQKRLLEKRHHISILDNQVFVPPAKFLHVLIYYSVERVEDNQKYPSGLKLTVNNPDYLRKPELVQSIIEDLKQKHGVKLHMQLGQKIEGCFWI